MLRFLSVGVLASAVAIGPLPAVSSARKCCSFNSKLEGCSTRISNGKTIFEIRIFNGPKYSYRLWKGDNLSRTYMGKYGQTWDYREYKNGDILFRNKISGDRVYIPLNGCGVIH